MAAIKREPTPPPGPIADLFDRLDDLHSKAGRPSMREIAIRAGRGNISSSTVHNLFRRSQVPRWAFVEQVVKALGGAQEREAFLGLWEAAWRAENDVAAPRKPLPDRALPQGHALNDQSELPCGRLREHHWAGLRAGQRAWSGHRIASSRTRYLPVTPTSPAGQPS